MNVVLERLEKCLRCGECCKDMVVAVIINDMMPDDIDYVRYHAPDGKINSVIEDVVYIKSRFGCSQLEYDANGKARCKIYENRPERCKQFMCLRDKRGW